MEAAQQELKQAVHDYWNDKSCGVEFTEHEKFSRAYFDEIEEHRYATEPEILSFAQFTRHRGQTVLEVGVGAGTDFIQWARAGAEAYGIDLTEESVEHVNRRLEVYGLEAADVRVADSEALPYDDDTFDLVYSWGVIHHTPDMPKALREIVRVTRPGGRCKIMVYNRRSILVYKLWVQYALLKGQPQRSLAWALADNLESKGTKGYTVRELEAMLGQLPVRDAKVSAIVTAYDRLAEKGPFVSWAASALAALLGPSRSGFFLTMEFEKR